MKTAKEIWAEYDKGIKLRQDTVTQNRSVRMQGKPELIKPLPQLPEPPRVWMAHDPDGVYAGTSQLGQSFDDFQTELFDNGINPETCKYRLVRAIR